MAHRKNRHLRVVRQQGDTTDKYVEELMAELRSQNSSEEEPERPAKEQRSKFKRRAVTGIVCMLAVAVAVFLTIHLQTYTLAHISDTYKISGVSENSYEGFAGGVLKYSRDGISYLNQKGEEQWNQPCQMKSPFVDVNQVSAAVADKGGNMIMIFQKDGLKGEIQTTLPIERLSVSEQGVVSVILKNESTPSIVCYDTAGNILVEHQASLTGTGYPLDVAISADATVMQVVYLRAQDGKLESRVGYYNFGEKGEEQTDHEVASKEYKNSVAATGFFLNQSVSAVVGDNCLTLFKGKEVPEEVTTVTIEKEIQSVFHNEKYIGMILKNEGKEGYELRLYNVAGKKVMSKDFAGSYKNAKISGNQVILYDGKKCSIFLRSGVKKFEGEMNNDIFEIVPVIGVNKYIVINANGMESVRLVK